jgi:hypothetical protein
MYFFIQPKGQNMTIPKRFLTTSVVTTLATGFVVIATSCGALAHGGGGGGGGHQGGSDHQQQSDSNRQRQSQTAGHSGTGKADSSRKNSARTVETHHRTIVKLTKNTTHPVTDKTPVATALPAKPVAGAESNHPAEKTNPAETLASSASKESGPAKATLPVDTIHPIIVSTAPSTGTKTNGTASVTPPPDTIHPIISPPTIEVRDHTHPEGTPAPNEGGISRTTAAAPIITNTTPAAPNPHPTPIPFEQGKLTANTGEPVPVPTGPRESSSAAGDPYAPAGKGFDVAISRDHRASAQQECGTHPGCDLAGSAGSLASVAKGAVIVFGKATYNLSQNIYSSIKGLF